MTAPAPIDPVAEAERNLIQAALWWLEDQDCSSALAVMEEAGATLRRLRQERLAQNPALAALKHKLLRSPEGEA